MKSRPVLVRRKVVGRLLCLLLIPALFLSGFVSSPGFASGFHAITFVENDNASDLATATQTSDTTTNLTLFTNLAPALTNAGHTFVDWNTQANGSGTSYSDGASFDFGNLTGPIFLYAIWTSPYSAVTFAENDSSSDTVSETQSENSPSALTPFMSLSPSFIDPGHSFVGWNTQPDGSGSAYADGASYNFGVPLTLYAIWQSNPVFSAIFSANSGSGTIPAIVDPGGTSLSIPSGAALSNSGFTFSGWNTAANGSGTHYNAGASYTLNADQTFYAQWTSNPVITPPTTASQYVVTFAQEGGTVTPTFDTYIAGGPAITLPTPTLAGSSFNGWFSEPSGGILVGLAGSTFTPSASITLYANWSEASVIELNLNGNGASGSIAPLSGTSGTSVTLPGPSSMTNAGFILAAWNTAANGTGTSYAPGQIITLSKALTLYAQWSSAKLMSIHFKSDGGSGSLSTLISSPGSIVTLPGSLSLVKTGYTLKSWNTSSNGSGKTYALGQSVTLSTSLTLYARWKGSLTPVLLGAVGQFAKDSANLNAAMRAQIHKLAVSVKNKKFKKVTLYGYTAATGLVSLDKSLSRRRAEAVATYLRTQIRDLKVSGVTVLAAGEGSVGGNTSSLYSRVEVFAL